MLSQLTSCFTYFNGTETIFLARSGDVRIHLPPALLNVPFPKHVWSKLQVPAGISVVTSFPLQVCAAELFMNAVGQSSSAKPWALTIISNSDAHGNSCFLEMFIFITPRDFIKSLLQALHYGALTGSRDG